eukprot:385297-Pelagomonas_calceolata.AAC.6
MTLLSFKAPSTWRKIFALLPWNTYNLFAVSIQQKNFIPYIQLYMQPLQPKILIWRRLTDTDGSIMSSQSKDAQQSGASFFIPDHINHSKTIISIINPTAMDQLTQSS